MYIQLMGYEREVKRMPDKKMGRPTENPKSKPIHVRLDKESEEILEMYCNQEDISRAEAVRRGIYKLRSEIKNK